jgi:hypothetical protein
LAKGRHLARTTSHPDQGAPTVAVIVVTIDRLTSVAKRGDVIQPADALDA